MTNRKDKNYIGLRVSEEEHIAFEDKFRRTALTAKSFLQKCIEGDEFREIAPQKANDVYHQLLTIELNLMELYSSRFPLPSEEVQLYKARCDRYHKAITDISLILYLRYYWADN